ncbi:MAG: hypothetical protein D6731_02560 [Planctomycetota bacterium]|nr:MAG: hypothetical protein D6731_02560 [Planctomycetota bacterium]
MGRDPSRFLEEVDAVRARLDALRPFPHEVRRALDGWLRPRFLYCSEALGQERPLSPTEVAAFLERAVVGGGHPLAAFLALERHAAALDRVLDEARAGALPSVEWAREVHRMLVGPQGRGPGEWKREPSPATRRRGKAFRFAPPEAVDDAMRRLLEGLETELRARHPVRAVADFYYRFHAIHPFAGANGKVARLLAAQLLVGRGFPPFVVHPEAVGEYLDALAAVEASVPADRFAPLSPDLDTSPLVEFFAQNIVRVGERMTALARGERPLPSEFAHRVVGEQERLLEELKSCAQGSWRVAAAFEVRALFERVREALGLFVTRGPLYGIEVTGAEVVPSHAVPPPLRVGLPASNAGLVGVLSLAIRGDPLMAKAVRFPPDRLLHLGVTATALGMQLVLCWYGRRPEVHHGPAHAAEWPEAMLGEVLARSIDRARQAFEAALRERNVESGAGSRGAAGVARAPGREAANLPASASRKHRPGLAGIEPSEPPLGF